LADKTKKNIKRLYGKLGEDYLAVAKKVNQNPRAIKNALAEFGIKVKTILKPEERQQILDLYDSSNSVAEAAEKSPYSVRIVKEVWGDANLSKKEGTSSSMQNLEFRLKEVRDAYKIHEGDVNSAAKELGVYKYLVRQVWKDSGLIKRKRKISDEVIQKIIGAYSEFKGNITEASDALDMPYSRIRGIWKDNGLRSKRKKQVSDGYGHLGKEKYDEIVASYDSVNGVAIKAAEICDNKTSLEK